MFDRLIIGYDDSEQAEDALALGRDLGRAAGAELVVAGVAEYEGVIPPAGAGVALPPSAETLASLRTAVERELAEPAERVGADPRALVSTSAARGLEKIADRVGDLIVVGSCHHGTAGRILAGSVGQRLLQGSPRAVAIAPRGYAGRPQANALETVAVGFDGGAESELALEAATALAGKAGARLRIVGVVRPQSVVYGNGLGVGVAVDLEAAMREAFEEQVGQALAKVGDEVTAEGGVLSGQPEQVLGSVDADLVVVGSRRYGPVRSVLLGGVSLPLSRSSEVPLVVVPRGTEVAAADAA